ncbi:helix-turn-helix transcriptional regulator [Streptomyces sp. NBC_00878]|uniref:ArsR/SmtB family transcription factor n=1 Tax=Streptomyces sp. NBC_00878 TaxID=2975854 RepID=UPI0022581EEC|nr:helix-turn-helix domain-containing protein [Streptomyces sp. NBC_00878]MCX4911167.1 helix-turn-helix domain-containing protein [Streptomyces sp. NBC_00878]
MASRTSSPLTHPATEDFDLFQIMRALADPTRLAIVVTLASRPGLACKGFYPVVAKSALTRHLRILREAGLIRQHDAGTLRVNTLRKDDLDQRFPHLMALVTKEGAGRRILVADTEGV